jgi:hypothetical protein
VDIVTLDFYFPFIVLGYGILIAVLTSIPLFERVAEKHLTLELRERFFGLKKLGYICLFVGAAWSLQNLVLG